MVAQTLIAIAAAVANIAYWWWVSTRGTEAHRMRVEQRFGVTIARGYRGSWSITSGPNDAGTRFRVGLRHVGYYARAFLLWSLVLLAVIALQQYVFKYPGHG